jgi:hypothetical protein
MSNTVVVDTSIAIKWVLSEQAVVGGRQWLLQRK